MLKYPKQYVIFIWTKLYINSMADNINAEDVGIILHYLIGVNGQAY